MAILHPDKIVALNGALKKRPKPRRPDAPAPDHSALIHNLAAQMYAARRAQGKQR